jgi:tetratricopeptide (TPR) repeat protein
MAQIYLAVGHFKNSEKLFSSALEYISITRRDHESDHQDFFQLLRGLAISCQKTGELSKAEEALQSALKIVESLRGHASDEAVEIANQLKTVKHKITLEQGHRKRALIASTGGKLHDGGHVSGVPDSNRLSDINTILHLHKNIDRPQDGSRNVLGHEHPETLSSMNNLAGELGRQGKYEVAEKMHRRVLELSEKVLGPEHPNTLSCINNLAEVLVSQGKYEMVEKMYRQVLEPKKKC